MRRTILVVAVAATAAVVTAVGGAQTPSVTPFPSATVVQYFVAAETVTGPGAAEGAGIHSNYFPQGATIVFHATAGESKTGKLLTGDAAKYFYVKIPGQPNVKLSYSAPTKKTAGAPWSWSGSWTVPTDYPAGIVAFKVLLKSKAGGYGSFVQMPVATSQLTVTKKAA
jgi:hypothetical protein